MDVLLVGVVLIIAVLVSSDITAHADVVEPFELVRVEVLSGESTDCGLVHGFWNTASGTHAEKYA